MKSENTLCIMPTEFKDSVTGDTTYGYRIFNDVAATYDNTLPNAVVDPMELLGHVIDAKDDVINEMCARVFDLEQDVIVCGKLIPFEEFSKLVNVDYTFEQVP